MVLKPVYNRKSRKYIRKIPSKVCQYYIHTINDSLRSAEDLVLPHYPPECLYCWLPNITQASHRRQADNHHCGKNKALSLHLFTLQLKTNVKTMQGWGFANLPSLLYHPYLLCILFGMPSLHPFTFLMFKSCKTYMQEATWYKKLWRIKVTLQCTGKA